MVKSIPPMTSTGGARSVKRKSYKRGLDISIRTGGGNNADSKKKEKVEPIRSWTFVPKPKLTRYSEIDKIVLIERVKEPAVRILKSITEIVVVAFLPKVNKKDIRIILHGDILELSARAKDEFGLKKYAKEMLLPFMADPKGMKTSFENDILEIILKEREKMATKRRNKRKREKK